MRLKNFYGEFGKLLYAIASIDGIITEKERKEMMDLVRKELIPSETHTDAFGTNAAYYAEMEFDFLNEQIADPLTAFESFVDYVEAHHTALNEQQREMILFISEKLADTSNRTNQKEKALIEKLDNRLKRITFVKSGKNTGK